MSDEKSRIVQALSTMYSNADASVKKEATSYLEDFQKSPLAWETTHDILNDSNQSVEVKLFASQTLRSKIVYDFTQLPQSSLEELKNSVIEMILKYSHISSDKLIRTQLCISLSHLALQYTSWHNAMHEIINKFSNDNEKLPCLIEFLKVLPEELSDVKKTSLTDDEFNSRTQELISNNVEQVVFLLSKLSESSQNIVINSLVLDCLNSWIKECPIEQILQVTSLTNLIFQSLSNDESFDKSIECLCTIMRETRDIENHELIDALYQKILELHQYMVSTNKFIDDIEVTDGLTRLYVESGESWHVLIAKNPQHFKPLVKILLDCCKNDEDLDIVKYTFNFWYILRQLIELRNFENSKLEFQDIYSELIEIIIKHLTYPISDSTDLFNGDKEQEDKFKEFRYEMGDVLKDCCAVIGGTRALKIPFDKIQNFLNSSQQPHWQYLEAPLFSMRAMAKEVSKKEKQILPTIMQLLIQLPEHPKVRYAATLVLGRYTEWTSKNPEFLEPQLNYIIKGFEIEESNNELNKDILIAASHALMFFCQDCSELLINYLEQLYLLYGQVHSKLDTDSIYKLVDGLAHVLQKLPIENQYETTKMFLNPTIIKLKEVVEKYNKSEDSNVLIADQIEILTIFMSILRCKTYEAQSYPIANLYMDEIWPIIPILLKNYGGSLKVSERGLKLVKSSIQSFSTYLNPILGEIVSLLHQGFQTTPFGCYLWVSGAVIREYGDEYTTEEVKQEIYKFGIGQSYSFFQFINQGINMNEIPDVIEDYFRMMSDLLMYFPFKLIPESDLLKSVKESSLIVLQQVDEFEPLVSTLHFLIDLVSWGFDNPPVSFFEENPIFIKETVQKFLIFENQGCEILKVLIHGSIFKFPNDIQIDANDLLIKLLTVIPDSNLSVEWLTSVIKLLPNVNEREITKLIKVIQVAIPNKDTKRIRTSLKDFINWYSRKNVNPRLEH